ncbi:MAG: hypothetical protein H7196_03035 [candidate division SR1 bacterium]|nr:hypothetical protein [candidate division SR1 bacterium]
MQYTLLHPKKISWRVDIPKNGNILELYGDRTKKDLNNSLDRLKISQYKFCIEEITKDYLDQFVPLYVTNIESIKEGIIYDMYDIILHNPKHQDGYKALSLYLGSEYLGAILFVVSKSNKLYEIAKVFPKTILTPLKLNITFIAEYKLYEYAVNNNIKYISLGVDTNYFGRRGNIGLAIYKLRTGAQPYCPKKNDNLIFENIIFNHEKDDDMLVFLGTLGKKIEFAKLFLNSKTEYLDKYSQLLQNKKVSVEIIR